MKKLVTLAILIVSSALIASTSDITKVAVVPANSKIVYLAKKVTGEHTGDVKIAKGFLAFKKDVLVGGEFEIDMSTIANTDITDQDYHKKFIDHINSPDFFDTAKFKTASIKIKTATLVKDNNYKVTADLTIKGITKPVTFEANATKAQSTAKIVFDRTNYGIKFKSGKYDPGLGDKLIYDDVAITVTLATAPSATL